MVPIVFSYQQYRMGTTNLTTFIDATGSVTDIHIGAEPESIIFAGKLFQVTDFRFRSDSKLIDNITYAVTNGIIPAKSDPELEAHFKRAEIRTMTPLEKQAM